jgi:signal transduction protein with GAF and PtsI domain
MNKHTIYYDAIIQLTNDISHCKDPAKVASNTAESVKKAFSAKGCSIFLVDRQTRELGLVASYGLSENFIAKGPIHFMQEINEKENAGPITIYDVLDDPRIEYPEKAKEEGISSLLGVPIISQNKIIGALRIYTENPWNFSNYDISMAQAAAQICGMAMEICWICRDHEINLKKLKSDILGKSPFGLGRTKNMSELFKYIRQRKHKY